MKIGDLVIHASKIGICMGVDRIPGIRRLRLMVYTPEGRLQSIILKDDVVVVSSDAGSFQDMTKHEDKP